MTNNDTAARDTTIADAMRAASDRRLAATPTFIPNDRPARRDIIRSHRHSVKHRAIR